jgi:DNA repair exonuclease SbcCD nuclease subunit
MIVIMSDPHLGTNRGANTTVASRQHLKQTLFKQLDNNLSTYNGPGVTKIIAGDLFDKDTNDEAAILQGLQVMRKCDVILAGNHDLPNRANKVSTVQLLDELSGCDGTVVIPPVGGVRIEQGAAKCGTNITLIPHHATQQLFDEAIQAALNNPIGGLVITHCNFDSDRATHDDASLNMPREQAQQLLDAGYEYILNGHEHAHSTHLGGRFVNLGNTHPTSMGDISDKYLWTYTHGKLEKHLIWDAHMGYAEIEITGEPAEWPEPNIHSEFVDLVGTIAPEHGPELAEYVTRWFGAMGRLMVRNRVGYTTDILVSEASEGGKIHDLEAQISSDLSGSDLGELWNHYRAEVQ